MLLLIHKISRKLAVLCREHLCLLLLVRALPLYSNLQVKPRPLTVCKRQLVPAYPMAILQRFHAVVTLPVSPTPKALPQLTSVLSTACKVPVSLH